VYDRSILITALYARLRRIDAAAAAGWCWRAEAKGAATAGDGRCSAALSTQSAVSQSAAEV